MACELAFDQGPHGMLNLRIAYGYYHVCVIATGSAHALIVCIGDISVTRDFPTAAAHDPSMPVTMDELISLHSEIVEAALNIDAFHIAQSTPT